MDDRAELARFAELLMRRVRDEAIAACDNLAAGRMSGPDGTRWREATADPAARAAVRELIPDVVDQALFELLNALDNGDLPLGWQRDDGSWADLYDLGRSEMAGWFMVGDGWRAQHSRQRFFDPDDQPS
ncbi:hypothetical protein [Micromonospora sp. NPDC048830]|uniref:hypothetical protein n=1 Tax=Micromonospora sp. NPDC048830 TaxID=3364257 RepID=UPI003712A441